MSLASESIPKAVGKWMFEVALPLWAERGYDFEHGGFVERFNLATLSAESPYKRMRVQARQIYVFSHAHLLGWNGPASDLAARAFAFMKKGWMPGRGWARVLSPTGEIVDDTIDLYDQAFVLFALGWFLKAGGDPNAARLAKETLEAVHANLRHPTGKGYLHVRPPTSPWLQNPHMHMLEGAISLAHATNDGIYFEEALRLGQLFRTHFYDAKTRTLAEYYDAAWNRMPGDPGRIAEPGHQFEWSWLLYELVKLTGEDFRGEAKGLYDFAETYGVDPGTQFTVDEVRDDGEVLKSSVRLWPQTEALKANLAAMEQDNLDKRERANRIVANLFNLFLDKPAPGLWIDHYEADHRTPKVAIIPASSLYHVFLAYSEVLRLKHLFDPASP